MNDYIDIDTVDTSAAPAAPAPMQGRPVTSAQRWFINRLLAERDTTGTMYEGWTPDWSRATTKAASAVIDYLLTLPRKEREPQAEVPEGMHSLDGRIYKVQRAVHGSGNLYAKRLTAVSHPAASDGRCYCSDLQGVLCGVCREPGQTEWAFEYAPGVMKYLSEATAMTLEQAKEFGQTYGQCVRCGRTLTDEDSVALGIGPICAGKEGWA